MHSSPRRGATASFAVLALLASLFVLLVPPASAHSSAQAVSGRVRGEIVTPAKTSQAMKIRWFTRDWTQLGERRVTNGAYSLTLPEGSYRLQFVDTKPQYDITKLAPADVEVTVRGGSTVQRTVRMKRGAAITGTVRTGTKPGAKARVVAANTYEQSFEVQANARGEFAIGGLPDSSYSVFTYDHKKQWSAKSTWAPRLKGGEVTNVAIALQTRAGGLLVDLYGADQRPLPTTWVTAVNRSTGQFYVEKAAGGSVTFAGLFPGRYRLTVPDAGGYLGRTASVGRVRPGRVTFGDLVLTQPAPVAVPAA